MGPPWPTALDFWARASGIDSGGCAQPLGRLLSVTNATQAGTCRQGTVAGRRLGALEGGYPPPSNASLGGGGFPDPRPASQPLRQPPSTACLTAAGAASAVPPLLMHPCPPSPSPHRWVDFMDPKEGPLVCQEGPLSVGARASPAVQGRDVLGGEGLGSNSRCRRHAHGLRRPANDAPRGQHFIRVPIQKSFHRGSSRPPGPWPSGCDWKEIRSWGAGAAIRSRVGAR